MAEMTYWAVVTFTIICFAVEFSIKDDDDYR